MGQRFDSPCCAVSKMPVEKDTQKLSQVCHLGGAKIILIRIFYFISFIYFFFDSSAFHCVLCLLE